MALDADHVSELFEAFGAVQLRRMFGGAGVFRDGLMFGLELRGVLYLKADASTEDAFRAEGSEPFSYDRSDGRRTVTSYWRIPERLLDEPDELARWAKTAFAVARAAKAKAPAKRRAGSRSKTASRTT